MKRFGIKLGLKSPKMHRKQPIYGKTVGNESVNSIFFPSQSVNDLTRRTLRPNTQSFRRKKRRIPILNRLEYLNVLFCDCKCVTDILCSSIADVNLAAQ
jgi:hypothetical protein